MFSLRHLFDPTFKAARLRAIEHVRRSHPDYVVGSASLRADEPGRHVFAVGYRRDGHRTIPDPYLIVAVPKHVGEVEELVLTPQSPYWIRGRK